MSSTKSFTTGCNKDSKAQCCVEENKGEQCCSGQKCCEKKCDCNCCSDKKCKEKKYNCNCAANKSCSDKKCCNDESTCNCNQKEKCCSDKKCCESSIPEPETKETEEYPNACKCQGCICLCMLPENRRQ